jgi:hypothetical protein
MTTTTKTVTERTEMERRTMTRRGVGREGAALPWRRRFVRSGDAVMAGWYTGRSRQWLVRRTRRFRGDEDDVEEDDGGGGGGGDGGEGGDDDGDAERVEGSGSLGGRRDGLRSGLVRWRRGPGRRRRRAL